MKVIFYTVYMPAPHFETELELMQEHLLQGDDVYLVHCKGELSTCFANPEHYKHTCILCKSRFESGINLLHNKEKIHLMELPPNTQTYSEIPPVFQTIDELKEFKIGNAEVGISAASSLISSLNREHRLNTVKHEKRVFKEVNNAYYVYLFFKNILADIKPDMVYLFNGRLSTVLPAINACEEAGIDYATHERGGTLDKYFLGKNTTPHDLENANREIEQLWETADQKERVKTGQKFFADRRNRVEHSWYSFTKEQKAALLPADFDPAKKNIAFYNSTIEEYAAIRSWRGMIKIYKEEIIAFTKIFESLENDSNIHIYLRVHPNLRETDNSQMREIKSLINRFKNVTIILPESPVDSYALMENCDTIITFGSTMGAEACYWNKPSILLGTLFYEKLDCCYIPTSHEETIDLIRKDLAPKNKTGALKYGFWSHSRGFDFKYFAHTGLTSGLFHGQQVQYSRSGYIKALFYYLLSPKAMKNLFRSLIDGRS